MEKRIYMSPQLRQIDLEAESILAKSSGFDPNEGDGGVNVPEVPWGTQKKSIWDESESKIWK